MLSVPDLALSVSMKATPRNTHVMLMIQRVRPVIRGRTPTTPEKAVCRNYFSGAWVITKQLGRIVSGSHRLCCCSSRLSEKNRPNCAQRSLLHVGTLPGALHSLDSAEASLVPYNTSNSYRSVERHVHRSVG
jgi:hypothetical protein